jgi:tetratricopeptide (TPR) repeat protein
MGFAELGGLAKKDTTFAAGMHWLSSSREPWLLIIDNADDCNMDVSRYFPAGGRGHIILTTRNPNNVVHATIGEAGFREMEEEEAITLLLKASQQPGADDHNNKGQRNLARPITSALGYLAIAIIHAGATIRRKLYSLESYLLVYEKELMNQRLLPPSNTIERSIITTYEIPFSATLKRTDLAAVDASQILHIFAFLHFQQIPETIFRHAWNNLQNTIVPELEEPKSSFKIWPNTSKKQNQAPSAENHYLPSLLNQVTWDEGRLRDALAVLYDLSFIQYDTSKQMCWMHPIVRLWAQRRLQAEEKEYWLKTATSVLALSISPVYELSGRSFRKSLIPHIAACLQTWQSETTLAAKGYLYKSEAAERFAAVYAEVGDWKTSRGIGEKLLGIRRKEFGSESSKTLTTMVELGKVYWNLFQVGKSIKIRSEICENRAKVLGPKDSLTLTALSDLASAYWLAGDRAKSLDHARQAAKGLSESRGLDDPTTLTAIFHLSRTQFHLGDLEAARIGLEQVSNAYGIFFGTKHPETLMAMAELGVVYHSLQRMEEAENLLCKVIKTRTEILGEEHAYTLWTVNDLCKVYTDSGRAKLALKMLDSMIPVVVRTLGERHVGMHMTKFNLARAYNALGRWRDAEKVLLKQIDQVASLHPDYIAAIIELAWVYENLQQYSDAEVLYSKALHTIMEVRERGVNKVQLFRVAVHLEEIYIQAGQTTKIDDLRKEIDDLTGQQ